MIEVQNLTKYYGSVVGVKDLSFTVQKGEIVGFLGPNGAGKSTTMNIITGYIPPTEGTVKVCGYDIMEEPIEVKKRIGYLPELPPLYFDMTVIDYLNFVSELKKANKKTRESQISDIMEMVGITEVKERLIKNLSKGYKQRVGLAQALIGKPEVLVLDEPTIGLDPKQIIEIRKLIKALGKEHTVILSSHILSEVSAICERIIIIHKGEIAAVDTPDNLSKSFGKITKIQTTISGPKNPVLGYIKEIYGVKYVNSIGEKEKDVVTYVIESDKDVDVRRPLFFAMAKAGYPIIELKSMGMTLEEVFLQVVTEDGKEVGYKS